MTVYLSGRLDMVEPAYPKSATGYMKCRQEQINNGDQSSYVVEKGKEVGKLRLARALGEIIVKSIHHPFVFSFTSLLVKISCDLECMDDLESIKGLYLLL